MAQQNPTLNTAINEANAVYNGNTEAYFRAECKKHGMSDDQVNAFVQNFAKAMGVK